MSEPTDRGFAETILSHLQTRFLGKPLHFFPVLDSTNTYAAHLAREGAPEGTVVIADSQSRGKGRLGRTWISPPQVNLYLSTILRPPVPASAAPQVSLLAAVAVAETISSVCHLVPSIKWPNDVLAGGKKVCGILAEMQTSTDTLRAIILGIGVNLNAPLSAFPKDLRDKASSLLLVSGQPVDRGVFTARLLTHLEKLYILWVEKGFSELRQNWEYYATGLIGKQITVAASEGTLRGTVLGLDTDGALLLQEEPDTTPLRLLAGEVTVVGGYEHGEGHDPRD